VALLPLSEVKARTYKARDSWWTVALVDPVSARITRRLAPVRAFTPNRVTMLSFAIGILAAVCFAFGTPAGLIAGAVLYHVSFTFDCVDGKIARLNGTGSIFGAWLDYILDRVRILACTIALMGGQYAKTGNNAYLILGGVVVFLDMFRYLNALEVTLVHQQVSEQVKAAGESLPTTADGGGVRMTALIGGQPTGKRAFLNRARDLLQRSRIRPHLVGGIEFQMAVFIIAPIVGAFAPSAIIPITIVAGALMVLFELSVIYVIYRATTVADHRSSTPLEA
jgi:phosphatidylglycerophosphate synthase